MPESVAVNVAVAEANAEHAWSRARAQDGGRCLHLMPICRLQISINLLLILFADADAHCNFP